MRFLVTALLLVSLLGTGVAAEQPMTLILHWADLWAARLIDNEVQEPWLDDCGQSPEIDFEREVKDLISKGFAQSPLDSLVKTEEAEEDKS